MTGPVTPTILREWLTQQLASNELRERVRDAVQMAYFEGGASAEDIDGLYADAALAAIVRHLTPHDCSTCADCIHIGNKCCGCYDNACCKGAA